MALAQAANDSDERSSHVLALGELGVSPVAFLHDPSPAARMCAALASGLSDNLTALYELQMAYTSQERMFRQYSRTAAYPASRARLKMRLGAMWIFPTGYCSVANFAVASLSGPQ